MRFKTARRRQPSLTAKARPNNAMTCGGILRRVAPGVTVMKTARARRGHHCRVRGRLRLNCSRVRRVLLQGIVNAIVMVIVHVCSDQPVEMPFVQRDDLVEEIAPAAAHPALGDAVLPWRLNGRARRVQTCGFQEPDDIAVKRRVVVKQHEAMRTIARKYIPQLLHDPRGCRLASHVDVQDPAPTVFDDEEAREQLEDQRGDGEEIAGDDGLAVIGEKRGPAGGRIAAAWNASQIPGDAAFGDVEAELQEFAVDPGRSPVRILRGQATDQGPNLLADPRPAPAMLVGSKVYTLKVSSDNDKMEFGKLAGKMAKITGEVTGDNVMVKSVAMRKAKKK